MTVDLQIAGKIEVLRLEPGDRIVATINPGVSLTPDQVAEIRAALDLEFPDSNVLVVQGLSLSAIKEEEEED
jgi:hypothetical protein